MNRSSFATLVFIVAVLSFIQYSCSSDKLPATCDEIGIDFEAEILPIIVSNCSQSGCHNSDDMANGYDFTSYDGIMTAIVPFNKGESELYESITATNLNDVMPPLPSSPLTASQIDLIGEWIDKGAPNTFGCSSSCDTLTNVSFSSQVLPVLQLYCVSCHSGSTPQAGIDQSTWVGVNSTVNDGSFLGSIKHESGYEPMPLNAAKINACDILLLETWVDEGALNN